MEITDSVRVLLDGVPTDGLVPGRGGGHGRQHLADGAGGEQAEVVERLWQRGEGVEDVGISAGGGGVQCGAPSQSWS